MPETVRDRLEQAIREEERRSQDVREPTDARTRDIQERFQPVREAAEELREQLFNVPSMEFTVNPDSVWITLGDRMLRFSYQAASGKFRCEEAGHSWYDAEMYEDVYEWTQGEECVEAMIRFCAKYVRLARALAAPTPSG